MKLFLVLTYCFVLKVIIMSDNQLTSKESEIKGQDSVAERKVSTFTNMLTDAFKEFKYDRRGNIKESPCNNDNIHPGILATDNDTSEIEAVPSISNLVNDEIGSKENIDNIIEEKK